MEKNLHFIELHRLLLELLALAEAVGKVAARTRIIPCTAMERLDQHPSMTKLCIAWPYINNNVRDALIGIFTKKLRSRSRSALRLIIIVIIVIIYSYCILLRLRCCGITQAQARDS